MQLIKDHNNEVMKWACEIALNDSQTAFRSLFVAYYTKLLRFASLYTEAMEDAEECVSDAFMDIWENRQKLTTVQNVEAYLYTVVRYKAISKFRMEKHQQVELDENYIDLFKHTETTPEDDLISKEMVEQINQAINSLPDKCKIAFKLVREDKMKYKEAATIMNISVKTLEAHVTTAVKKIRQILMQIHN